MASCKSSIGRTLSVCGVPSFDGVLFGDRNLPNLSHSFIIHNSPGKYAASIVL